MRASAVKAEEELQTPKKTSKKKKVKVDCDMGCDNGAIQADVIDHDGDWVTVSGDCRWCRGRGYNWKTHH